MKYTDWLIPELRMLDSKRSALVNIPERIKTLEMSFAAIRAARTDGEAISGSKGNMREEALLANIAERDELKANLAITQREVEQLDKALATLSKEERLVIERFYIQRERNYVDRLCEELNCEQAQVYRIKNNALIHLARTQYGQVKM